MAEAESTSLMAATATTTTTTTAAASDTRGKHRVLAELKRVEQELKFLEDEWKEVEKSEAVSTLCQELICNMEARPDPLLPITSGPINLLWDRWFEGDQDIQRCKCWIL